MMYYSSPQIVMQEVPDEISLALSMSGCSLACKGCHSTSTWLPTFGIELTTKELARLIKKHKHITCVLFYGGEWDAPILEHYFKVVKKHNLKICLYTGLELEEVPERLLPYLDYIKVGRYIEELGGLDSPATNQRFIKLKA